MIRAAILALALLPAAASAQPVGAFAAHKPSSASYAGAGDAVSGATAWYGLRAYTAAYAAAAGKLVNARRASDGETCDILAATTGGVGLTAGCSGGHDGLAPATWLAATTGYVVTAYDQTGGGKDATQATTTKQPILNLSCIGSRACLQFSGGQGLVATAGMIQPATIAAVAQRTGAFTTNAGIYHGQSSLLLDFSNTANNVRLYAGTTQNVAAADNVAHSLIGIATGASSVVVVDGAATGVSPGTGGVGGTAGIGSAATVTGTFLTGYVSEDGIWPGAFNSTQYGSLRANQKAFWGTP